MKTCPELEEWDQTIGRESRWETSAEKRRLDVAFLAADKARTQAVVQVRRLLDEGILIHHEDADGLRAALAKLEPEEDGTRLHRNEGLADFIGELMELASMLQEDDAPGWADRLKGILRTHLEYEGEPAAAIGSAGD